MSGSKYKEGDLCLIRHYEKKQSSNGINEYDMSRHDDYVMQFKGRDTASEIGYIFKVLAKKNKGPEELGVTNFISRESGHISSLFPIEHERILSVKELSDLNYDGIEVHDFNLETDVPLCLGWHYVDKSLLNIFRKE